MTQTDTGTYYKAPVMGASLRDRLARARQWDIEYGGYLSNHLTHNWVVMSAAGAPEAKLQWWEDLYTNKLEEKPAREEGDLDPPRTLPADHAVITRENWRDHFQTTRIGFPAYRNFFDARIADSGISATLREYLPALLPGLAGAALHPLIHTGWGVEAGSSEMTADGLAYMATAFQPLATGDRHSPPDPPWSPEAAGPVAAALAFLPDAQERGLSRIAQEASQTEAYMRLDRGRFQPRLIAFDDPALPLGAALNAAGPVGLPPETEPLTAAIEEMTALIAAALRGSGNEFFVLHGLTSLHAALVLVPHLEPRDQRAALAHWWRAAMATVVAQDFPGLAETADLLKTWRTGRNGGQSVPYRPTDADKDWWRQVLGEAFVSLDEHTPKAVYVLWRWTEWEAFSGATAALFANAAEHLVKPHPSGRLHENLWISGAFSDASQEREAKDAGAS